ncbi:MAG: PQQ-dependent dehydrogenase, methanol/ethanol family [Vicinamibacterales bacterium]
MLNTRLTLLVGSFVGLSALALVAQQAQVADTVINPLATDPAAAGEGQRTFAATCQACHGVGAQGDRERGAPALTARGFKHGDGDGDVFRAIRSGVPGTQMPPYAALTDQQTWQLVAYIRSLQQTTTATGKPAAAGGDTAAGEALFFGNKATCASCHEINGRGGVVGPDLSNAGRLDPAIIRQKITSPGTPMPGGRGGRGGAPVTVVAKTRDGKEIRGVRRNEDTFSLQMVDASGQLHLLNKLTLASVSVENKSLMPADFAKRLTTAEIENLVAYLGAQSARNPAAIAAQPMAPGGLTYDRLVKSHAEPGNWPMYWGDYQGTHYSALTQITSANAKQLRAAWTFPLFGGTVMEGAPLVVDGVMYATGSGNPTTVVAIDARSGRQIWRFTRPQRVTNPYQINPFSRGVAILGQRVYVGTLDAALVALDARTGRPLWEVQVADSMLGHNITSPPLVLKDKVIVGVAGGEFGTRGFLDAYDAATGKRAWRFYTIPGPGEPGNETWKGDSWKTGGSPTWLTGSFDPELNTLYWTVGNPAPQIDRSTRGDGDNLYSNSVVALNPDTGTLKWHYQFTPNDGHDWDSVQDLVLVDRQWRGQPRQLLLHADRNAHFYVLDRVTGQFLSGTPFVYQNWNTGFDEKGRPKPVPNWNSNPDGTFFVYPTLVGGTNWQSPSYSALTGWFYLEFAEGGQQYTSVPAAMTVGQTWTGSGRGAKPAVPQPNEPAANAGIRALDPETGKTMWTFPLLQGSLTNGVLATAGNVLFASSRDGNVIALDSKTGAHLWHFQTGGDHAASPISYAVDGKQYVALAAGNVIISFALVE